MKKKNRIILIALMAVLMTTVVFAADEIPDSDLSTAQLAERYWDNYSLTVLEADNALKIGIGDALCGMANGILGIGKEWIKFVALAVESVLDFNFVSSKVGETFNGFIATLTGTTNPFGGSTEGLSRLAWAGVLLSLCVVVYMFARNRTSGAIAKFIQIAVIGTLISSYTVIPTNLQGLAQDITNSVQQSLFSDEESGGAKGEILIIGVDLPWQQLECNMVQDKDGAVASGSEYGQWLKRDPEERRKNGTFDENILPNILNQGSIQGARFGKAVFVTILNIVMGFLFLLISILGIGLQIGAFVMWVLGFFVLILSLFPSHGTSKIREWAGFLAVCYFGQILVSIALLLVLKLVKAFYSTAGNNIFIVYLLIFGTIMVGVILKGPIGTILKPSTDSPMAAGGGIVDMGKRKLGWKGDSTQRIMPNPIKQNMEARRMAQRQKKMNEYAAKMQHVKDKKQDAAIKTAERRAGSLVGARLSAASSAVGTRKDNVKDTVSKTFEGRKENKAAKKEAKIERAQRIREDASQKREDARKERDLNREARKSIRLTDKKNEEYREQKAIVKSRMAKEKQLRGEGRTVSDVDVKRETLNMKYKDKESRRNAMNKKIEEGKRARGEIPRPTAAKPNAPAGTKPSPMKKTSNASPMSSRPMSRSSANLKPPASEGQSQPVTAKPPANATQREQNKSGGSNGIQIQRQAEKSSNQPVSAKNPPQNTNVETRRPKNRRKL